MDRWLVLYDGDCGLCMWLLAGILRWDRRQRLQPVALQTDRAAELLADLSPEQRLASWHLIALTGERPEAAAETEAARYSAGAALPPILRLLPAGALPASALAATPELTERAYRWVAAHRNLLSKLIPAASKRKASAYVSRCESMRIAE